MIRPGIQIHGLSFLYCTHASDHKHYRSTPVPGANTSNMVAVELTAVEQVKNLFCAIIDLLSTT